MLHIDIENKSTYSNNSLFTCCGCVSGNHQMEGNNRGRGRRVPLWVLLPPQTAQHTSARIHTDRHSTQALIGNKWFFWLHARVSREKKKLEREQHDGNIWKAETERHERDRGWKREKRKKNDSRSVKESQNGFSTCEKKKEGHCYKFPRPALDLIWAGMQTTHRSSLNRVLRVECECMRACVCACVCVCVWAAEGLVAREILTYRAPLPAALSLASTSQRKRFAAARLIYNLALSLSLPPSLPPSRPRLFLFLSSLSFFSRHQRRRTFLFVISTPHCTNHYNFTICICAAERLLSPSLPSSHFTLPLPPSSCSLLSVLSAVSSLYFPS